jgi:tetratricopeptide (TPR) repeat protein
MLKRFVELRPDSAAGFFFLGRTLLSAGELRRSADALRYALSIRPGLGYAQSLLGYIYLKLGRSSEALSLLGEAVKRDPDNTHVYAGYLNALLVEGIKSFKRGYYEYAEEVFSFLTDNGERGILPYLYLGMIHRIQGEYKEALKDYRNALSYSPEDRLITYRIALLLLKTGRDDEARELFMTITPGSREHGKFTAPTASEGDRYLARQYFERENYSQALHYALQVLHQDKNDVTMHLLAGECYREMEEYELASNHFTRVFDSDRKHMGAHYGIALIHWQLGEYDEMLGRLRKVERLDPGNETVHYYTVLCNWKLDTDASRLLPVVQEAVRSFQLQSTV